MKCSYYILGGILAHLAGTLVWAQTVDRAIPLYLGRDKATWVPTVSTDLVPTTSAIEERAKRLASRERNLDTFGLPMYPTEEDVVDDKSALQLAREAERITLNQALQSFKVIALNLVRREFLLNGRNVFEGDVVVLGFRGKVFQAQVVEVGEENIKFQEVETGETGILPHNLLPRFSPEPLQSRIRAAPLQGKASPLEPVQ